MLEQFKYAGAGALLLTLACGPRVEIGHGDSDGGSPEVATSGGTAGTGGNSATNTAGADPSSEGGTVVGTAGTSATAGGTGTTGPVPDDTGPQAEAGKVDLLLAIDNSMSMAEKQKLFAKALPELVTRLINPRCVSTKGQVVEEPASPETPCPAGSKREYEPLRDLHVGVITSSLGSHGASGGRDVCTSPEDDDHAHLIATVRAGLPSYNNGGYLNWDPDGKASPAGEADARVFADALKAHVEAAGESGCGYEAQLESIYRFLVDPAPPTQVVVPAGSTVAVRQGLDNELLAQRERFLRPDSSVVVLMLTDENDCSIQDAGYGYLVPRTNPMFRASSTCATAPNDPCCQVCAEPDKPGCPSLSTDSECAKGKTLPTAADDLNLRCWDQKRRFGMSLLYPIERYVGGFGDAMVPNQNGSLVPNPLFHHNGVDRSRSLFTLAVIGGVPWQDLATGPSLNGDNLDFMTPDELRSNGRWSVILGAPDAGVPPTDPFMSEQTDPRMGENPVTGESTMPADSLDPQANSINGHEQVNVSNSDLQYACTFELPEPVTCDDAANQSGKGCDCFKDDLPFNRPLCQSPNGSAPSIEQFYGKAYPALRELAVAEQLGRRTVLGSICSRNTQDDTRQDYGYRPVFNAIGRRIAATLIKP